MNTLPRRDSDLGQLLCLAGMAMIGVFLVSVLWGSWPVQLLQPQWVLQLSGQLRGGASFPLVGVLMLLLGHQLQTGSKRGWSAVVRQVRALAIPAAVGFLLLIPLQAYGLWGQAQAEEQQLRITLDRLTAATRAIESAPDEPALREAISNLPGAAAVAGRPLQDPPELVKRQILAELTPQIRKLMLSQRERQNARLRQAALNGSRDGLICLLYAIPFAAIGRWHDRRYSFLSDIIDLFERIPGLISWLTDLPRRLHLPFRR